jgi:hypothetical protein
LEYVITGLTDGVYYDVAVQARNVVGDSLISDSVRIVAANAPEAPSVLQVV